MQVSKAIDQFCGVNGDPMLVVRNAGAWDALRINPAKLMEVMRHMKRAAS